MENLQATAEADAKAEQQKKEAEAKRSAMLGSCLTTEARERLDRIALVNPSKARAIGDSILQRAANGLVASKIDENQLKRMLDEAAKGEENNKGKVQFQRKKYKSDSDSDDDDDDDLL